MNFDELAILLPCHSLEDFPTHYEGELAEGLLAHWSALWHPALIRATQRTPTWYRADDPPPAVVPRLLLVPAVSAAQLPSDYAAQMTARGGQLIEGLVRRAEVVARLLELSGTKDPPWDADLVADFLALGYAYLQVQLLTRQMRYSSLLDENRFRASLVAAAEAVAAGDTGVAHQKLGSCYDLLSQERDHYYSVDVYLIDLMLVTADVQPTTVTSPPAAPGNWLLTADVLQSLAVAAPQLVHQLSEAVAAGRLSVVGGEFGEPQGPLVSCEVLRAALVQGRAIYEQHLAVAPRVFGRRRSGMVPLYPQLLRQLGYTGAVHATFEEGSEPAGHQAKVQWESPDGTTLDALGKPPLDAALPETFLSLATRLGQAMDRDFVATLCFAHWPGHTSPFWDDLARIGRYSSCLGKLVTLDEYFRSTALPGRQDRWEADAYRTPYLAQAVRREDPAAISTSVEGWREHVRQYEQRTLEFLDLALTANPKMEGTTAAAEDDGPLRAFAARLPRQAESPRPGYLVVNPLGFVRRLPVGVARLVRPPDVAPPIYAAGMVGDEPYVLVDVPPQGYAWIEAGTATSPAAPPAPPIAQDNVLRNEFCEAVINPVSGNLQGLRVPETRTNRMAQQLGFRLRDRGYSVMAADSLDVTRATPLVGEIVTRGRLLDREGKELAGYEQTYRLWRGSRILELEMVLTPRILPLAEPWNSYFACRFAWPDEAASLWRAVNEQRAPAEARRFEAPLYVEIESGDARTTILTAGLPYHRRTEPRLLDSLLIVRGEQQQRFRVGIGLDLRQPLQEALGFLAPPRSVFQEAPPPTTGTTGWLVHLDARHVLVTAWCPLVEDDQLIGFRARFLEVAGRATRPTLSCFRPIREARTVDFLGAPRSECVVSDGRVRLELAPHEWQEVIALW